jgi:hypothetical protein
MAVDFVKDIRPILAQRCYECHGEKKQKGDLRLDRKEDMLTFDDLIGTTADTSSLYGRVILPADHDDIMPPKGDPLTKDQQELIKKWIEAGANFGDWTEEKPKATATIIELPKVDPADMAAVAKVQQLGGLALPLAATTNLIQVDFRAPGDQITDGHMDRLDALAGQIAWLGLGRTKVTDAGLVHVGKLKMLMRLSLENTAITDAGLAHLQGLDRLEYLNLYGTKITDAGLLTLKSLKSLRSVYVWNTGVTEAGAAALKKELPNVEVNLGVQAEKKDVAAAGN